MTAPERARVPDAATLETLDRWIDFRLWHTRTPGAQVAVGVDGVPFFSRAYGYADLEQAVPMTTGHLFRIASHSKTFTATLVLQLVEQGSLGLDDPVGDHVPALAGTPVAAVRVRELLEHTSGVLRDSRDADFWVHDHPFPDLDRLLELTREGGLKTGPGERFAYSNIAYGLAGLVVEAVTGTSFGEALQERIAGPLGLVDTTADLDQSRADDYAVGYASLHTATRRVAIPSVATGALAPATGVSSTATDLVRYFAAHAFGDDRLLSDRTKRLQQRQANLTDPRKPGGEAYGWGMGRERIDDQLFVGHGGGFPGHITKTLLDPETGLVISVLTNSIDGPASALAKGVAQILAAAAAPRPDGPELSEDGRRWVGRYANAWGVVDVAAVGGRLHAVDPTGWAPLEDADALVEDGDQLRIDDGSGFGSVGEPVTRLGDGRSIRYGGMTMAPFPDLPGGTDHRWGTTGG